MKKTFLLMSLLLGLVVSGMLVTSCGDDDDEGGNGGSSELVRKLKGTWEMAGDYGTDWNAYFWEFTDRNVYFYGNYGDMDKHDAAETYNYTVKGNDIIHLVYAVDGIDQDSWIDVKVVSVTSEKLVVYWDYENGEYDEKMTLYRVNKE